MCDDASLTAADMRSRMFQIIERYGWMVQYVEDEPDSFAYTIGLSGQQRPELMVEGLAPEASARLLNEAAHELLHGDLGPCEVFTASDGRRYLLGQMVDPSALYAAIEAYGISVEALQLSPM
jgi:hypothetical protein